MNLNHLRLTFFLSGLLLATVPVFAQSSRPVTPPTTRPHQGEDNPPAPDFNQQGSDPQAIALADAVMKKMGGRAAWEKTRFLSWNFFGRRSHVWDRATGDIRVEGKRRDGTAYLILMNIRSQKGRAWLDGKEVNDALELANMLTNGHEAWINDSYWLLMPYKLKDSGVMLKSLGPRKMEDGRAAELIELTFSEVGVTPQNKYHVYVAKDSGLVEQWDFFSDAADEEPRFRIPWMDWKRHGRILLSGGRGKGRVLSDIAVYDELPRSVFTSPEPLELPPPEIPSAPSSRPAG